MTVITKIAALVGKLKGAKRAAQIRAARASGERGAEGVLQGAMERMYAEADNARVYQLGKVKAAQQAVDIAKAQVASQLLTVKAAQRHLEALHDVSATKQLELEATITSANAFEKLLPKPGVSK